MPKDEGMRRLLVATTKLGRSSATDRELLLQFANFRDESAFEALVRRHTNLVLGVCRRSLPNGQDAEDACQAVFLILTKKAKSVRWEVSIANWLYSTARKVARNARRAAQRRAKREGQTGRLGGLGAPEPLSPLDQMTGRELLAALDDELERLPARYREPLVLYHLEGLSRNEIEA
jgi:RNA polymerase sigma factor (sigma-70 family)